MTFTAEFIRLPSNVSVRPGQYVRFAATGRFLSVEDYLTNGLGTIYQVQRDGTFRRYFF